MAALWALSATTSLTGCSNAGAATCDQYAAKSGSERSATEKALLEAHDLEPKALGNSLGVVTAINSYCGMNGIQDKETPKKNGGSPIESAVNWSANCW
ncbi:hypothetical protein GCM10009825_38750 [Arthrobacter humicola]|uniref:Lipoprotein n=1 Tax=Arthrobacter humicola TaxID=409291 RepID=A0ABP5LE07_9MICC